MGPLPTSPTRCLSPCAVLCPLSCHPLSVVAHDCTSIHFPISPFLALTTPTAPKSLPDTAGRKILRKPKCRSRYCLAELKTLARFRTKIQTAHGGLQGRSRSGPYPTPPIAQGAPATQASSSFHRFAKLFPPWVPCRHWLFHLRSLPWSL